MFVFYRDHLIMVLDRGRVEAEIAELSSKLKLPIKVSSSSAEGMEACLRRAFRLIDLYLDGETLAELRSTPQRQPAI